MLRPSLAVVLVGFVLKTSERVKNWLQARATEPLLTGLVVESTLVMSWIFIDQRHGWRCRFCRRCLKPHSREAAWFRLSRVCRRA